MNNIDNTLDHLKKFVDINPDQESWLRKWLTADTNNNTLYRCCIFKMALTHSQFFPFVDCDMATEIVFENKQFPIVRLSGTSPGYFTLTYFDENVDFIFHQRYMCYQENDAGSDGCSGIDFILMVHEKYMNEKNKKIIKISMTK